MRRLLQGGRVDRTQPLTFWFDGTRCTGFAGDTVASALLGAGGSARSRRRCRATRGGNASVLRSVYLPFTNAPRIFPFAVRRPLVWKQIHTGGQPWTSWA